MRYQIHLNYIYYTRRPLKVVVMLYAVIAYPFKQLLNAKEIVRNKFIECNCNALVKDLYFKAKSRYNMYLEYTKVRPFF